MHTITAFLHHKRIYIYIYISSEKWWDWLCILKVTVKMALWTSHAVSFFLFVFTSDSMMHWTSWAVSCPTSLIHRSCSRRTGTSSIHKWKHKQSSNERDTEKGWSGLSLSRTIKSKCISCVDPHCNPHLYSANTFTANKAYWIILTACGSGEERGRDRKWQGGWKVEQGNEKQESGSETERRAKMYCKTQSWGEEEEDEEERWGKEERENVTQTGKEQIALPPC